MSVSSPHPYIPNTDDDRGAMLKRVGLASVDELFADIPGEFRIDGLDLPPALPEVDLTREMSELARRNTAAGNGVASCRPLCWMTRSGVNGSSGFAT